MTITNTATNIQNAPQLIDTAKDLSNSPDGQQIMGRHANGEGVKATAGGSKADITDALEELGMAKAHRSKVDASKIKVKKGAGTDLDALGRIAEYLDKLPNKPSEQKYKELADRFQEFERSFQSSGGGGDWDAADVWAALAEYDGDAMFQFAALERAYSDAVSRGAPQGYLDLLNGVRLEMRSAERAQDITAGFQSAQTAARVSEATGGTSKDFRDTYRAMLREGADVSRLFERMKSFSLTENLATVLDGFIEVAGADMASFGPSTDPRHLGAVLSELRGLRQMVSVLGQAKEVLAKAERLPNADQSATWPKPEDLAGKMLEFTTAPVAGAARADQLVDLFGNSDPEFRASVINLLRDFHAGLPAAISPSDAQTTQQKTILMTLSDKLVEAEEAAFA